MKAADVSDHNRWFIFRDISKRNRTEQTLRTIELKKEINTLCAAIRQSPRHALDFAEGPA